MGGGEPAGQFGIELGLGAEPVGLTMLDEPEGEDRVGLMHGTSRSCFTLPFTWVVEIATHAAVIRLSVLSKERIPMRLVKLDTPDGTIYINPEHVVAVAKGLRDTKVETVSATFVVKDSPEVVARLLGMEEISLDVTPRAVGWVKSE